MFGWIKKLLIKPLWKHPGIKLLLGIIFFFVGVLMISAEFPVIESVSAIIGLGLMILCPIFFAAACLTYESAEYAVLEAERMLEKGMAQHFRIALKDLIEETKKTGKPDKLNNWMRNFYELMFIYANTSYEEGRERRLEKQIREEGERRKTKIATLKEEMGVQQPHS